MAKAIQTNPDFTYRVQTVYKADNEGEKIWHEGRNYHIAKAVYIGLHPGSEIKVQLVLIKDVDQVNAQITLLEEKQ